MKYTITQIEVTTDNGMFSNIVDTDIYNTDVAIIGYSAQLDGEWAIVTMTDDTDIVYKADVKATSWNDFELKNIMKVDTDVCEPFEWEDAFGPMFYQL